MVFTRAFVGFNWGQSYLATLRLRRKIEQKCSEILLLLYNFHIFASDQIKEESTSKFLSLWTNFWATVEQRLEKLRETFWEISSNLRKALAGRAKAGWGEPINTGSLIWGQNKFRKSYIKANDTLGHQPTAWPVPWACALKVGSQLRLTSRIARSNIEWGDGSMKRQFWLGYGVPT